MDSRGIYMARDTAESEKYAPLIIQTLRKIEGLMKEWTSLIRPEDKATMERANARVAEFVRFRSELVRLSREATLPESRAFGDNDANRNNRTALNTEIAALAASNDANDASPGPGGPIASYQNRLWLLIGLVTIGILVSLGLAIAIVVFAITRPINRLTHAMTTLAGGSTDITVPATDRGDEIGDMARAVQVFLHQALAVRGADDPDHGEYPPRRHGGEPGKLGREPGIGRLEHPAQRPEAILGRPRAEHAGDLRSRPGNPAGQRTGAQRGRSRRQGD